MMPVAPMPVTTVAVTGLGYVGCVEAAVLGTFESSGRLKLLYEGKTVADLDMHFLHEGRPTIVRKAECSSHAPGRSSLGHEQFKPLQALIR